MNTPKCSDHIDFPHWTCQTLHSDRFLLVEMNTAKNLTVRIEIAGKSHTLDLVSARYRQSRNSSGLLPRWFAVQGWLQSRASLVSDFIRTEGHYDTGSGQLRAEFIPITSVLSSIYVQSRSDILCRLRCDIESSIIDCLKSFCLVYESGISVF